MSSKSTPHLHSTSLSSSSTSHFSSLTSSSASPWQNTTSYYQLQTLQLPNQQLNTHASSARTTDIYHSSNQQNSPNTSRLIATPNSISIHSSSSTSALLSPIHPSPATHRRRRSRSERDDDDSLGTNNNGQDSDSSDHYSEVESENESLVVFPRSPFRTKRTKTFNQEQQSSLTVTVPTSSITQTSSHAHSQTPSLSMSPAPDQLYPFMSDSTLHTPPHLNFHTMKRRGSAPFHQTAPFPINSQLIHSSPPPQLQRTISHNPIRLSPPAMSRSKSLLNTRHHTTQFLLPPVTTPPSPARATLPPPTSSLTSEEAAIDALFSRLAMSERSSSPIIKPLHRRSSSSSLPSPLSSSPFNSPTASPTPSGIDADMREEDDDFSSVQWFVRIDGVEDEMDASNASDGRMGQTSGAMANTETTARTSITSPTSTSSNDILMGESMRSFFTSLCLAPDDWITLGLAWKWQCTTGGVIRRNEFISGMKSMDCRSIQDLQLAIKRLREELLSSLTTYRVFYTFVFHFIRIRPSQKNRKSIGMRQAIPLLISLLRERYERSIIPLSEYLHDIAYVKKKKTVVTLAEWSKILDWCIRMEDKFKLSPIKVIDKEREREEIEWMTSIIDHLHNGGPWPQLLIDYVKWRKEGGNVSHNYHHMSNLVSKMEKIKESSIGGEGRNKSDNSQSHLLNLPTQSTSSLQSTSLSLSSISATASTITIRSPLSLQQEYPLFNPTLPISTNSVDFNNQNNSYRVARPSPLLNKIDKEVIHNGNDNGLDPNVDPRQSDDNRSPNNQLERSSPPMRIARTTSVDMVD